MTGTSRWPANNRAEAIRDKLSNIGVNAGTRNRSKVLRIPPASAVSEISMIYGKVIRNIPADRLNSGRSSASQPGAKTDKIKGAAKMPIAVRTSSIAANVPVTWSIRSRRACRSPLALYSDRTGTNASEKEPSANRRRMKLGILKARKKASVSPLAPNIFARTTSRTKPRIREIMVALPTVAVDFSSFIPV